MYLSRSVDIRCQMYEREQSTLVALYSYLWQESEWKTDRPIGKHAF